LFNYDTDPALIPEWPTGSVMCLVLVAAAGDALKVVVPLTRAAMCDMAAIGDKEDRKLWFRIPRKTLARVDQGISVEDFERDAK
jgi:uncharacterized lipoprotein NlpE involved in copper resistance